MLVGPPLQDALFPVVPLEFGYNSDWNKASLRILFLFPSPVSVKMDSATPSTLYNIVKHYFGDRVFVDFCFSPPPLQYKAYYKSHPPIAGVFSRRTWEDFDIVGLSLSVARTEFAEAYRLLSLSGFPLNRGERMDDGKSPLLILGGVAADNSNGLDSAVDLVFIGLGESFFNFLCRAALEAQNRYGSVAKGKAYIVESLKWFPGLCRPDDYPYEWSVRDGAAVSLPKWGGKALTAANAMEDIGLDYVVGSEDVQRSWVLPGSGSRASVLASWGCGGAGSCYFCHEGFMYGPWRERSLDGLQTALRAAKASSMGPSVAFRSFNINYHSRFSELVKSAYEYFDSLSVLNFRLDAVAASIRNDGEDNYVRLLKACNTPVLAGAVEGFGERARNHLYNKNLSFEDIKLVAREVFKSRFTKFKTGYILSGHETGSEMREGVDEIKEIAALKRSLLSNTQYQISVTKLVHFYGTPLYRLPRVAALLNWNETYGGGKAFYPFADLPRDLVSLKVTGGIGDTFIQQLHQDLPGELALEILLKPAVDHLVGSRGYLDEVKRRLLHYGIDPKRQFLDFDPRFSPKRHYRVSPSQEFYDNLPADKVFVPRSPCLKTVSSEERGGLSCHSCGACGEYDRSVLSSGSIKDSLFTRDLGKPLSVGEVKAARQKNAPSFYYVFVFWVKEDGRFVSKDALVRSWFKKFAELDETFAANFRRFSYSFSRHMDYPGMVSNYCGYEAAVAGFKDEFDLDDFCILAGRVNGFCPTIQFVRIGEIFEKPQAPKFWALSSLSFDSSVDMDAVVRCFTKHSFRKYGGSVYRPSFVRLPFYYKASGSLLDVYYPAKVNPAFNLLELWHFNKFNRMLVNHTVGSALLPVKGRFFMDVVSDLRVNLSDEFVFVDGRV